MVEGFEKLTSPADDVSVETKPVWIMILYLISMNEMVVI
jgi:hypothetical protein